MKFRPGDLVLIGPVDGPDKSFNGMHGCVQSELVFSQRQHVHFVDIDGRKSWHPTGLWSLCPHEMRLLRPPSWDKFIYDTREVRNDLPLDREVEAM